MNAVTWMRRIGVVCCLLAVLGVQIASADTAGMVEKLKTKLAELQARRNTLDRALDQERARVMAFLAVEDSLLGIQVMEGGLDATKALDALNDRTWTLVNRSFQDEQLVERRTQLQSEAVAFLERVSRDAAAAKTWPGDRSATEYWATADAEVVRLRGEIKIAVSKPDRLRPLLSRAGEVLAWTQGEKALAPDRNWFADTERVRTALDGAQDRVIKNLENTKRGKKPAAALPVATGNETALLSIDFNDPAAGKGIVVLDPATGNRRRVYTGGTTVMSWRPDGSSFHAWDASRSAFMLVKPDGSASPLKMRCIIQQSWNPDGRKFYFQEGNMFGGIMKIFESNPDGSGKRQLLSDEQNAGNPECSPDGHRLAFSLFGRKCMVCVMNVDGTGVRDVAEGRDPVWSPDGKRLAFKTELGSQETLSIAVANPDGSDMRKILRQPGLTPGNSVAWMPDGKRIVYTFQQQSGDKRINQFGIVGVDGSGNRLLSLPDENCETVIVAPVGDAIVFAIPAIDNQFRGTWMITDSAGKRRALTDPTTIVCDWYASWSYPMSPATAAAWMEGAVQAGGGATGAATGSVAVTVSRDGVEPEKVKTPSSEAAAAYSRGTALAAAGRNAEAEPPNPKEVAAAEAYDRGHALMAAGRYVEAEAEYRQAVASAPNWPQYHLALGQALAWQGRWAEAEPAYRDAVRMFPDNGEYHVCLGNACANQQKWDDAERAYRESIRLMPSNPEGHSGLAWVLGARGQWPQSAAAYREAIRLDPQNAMFHFYLGNTYSRQQKWAEAAQAYNESARLNPANSGCQFALGQAYGWQGKWSEAQTAYEKAVQLDPKNAAIHDALGSSFYNQKKMAEAEAQYRVAIRLSPDYGAFHANLAGVLLNQNRRDDALVAAKEAIRLGFRQHWVYGQLGINP